MKVPMGRRFGESGHASPRQFGIGRMIARKGRQEMQYPPWKLRDQNRLPREVALPALPHPQHRSAPSFPPA